VVAEHVGKRAATAATTFTVVTVATAITAANIAIIASSIAATTTATATVTVTAAAALCGIKSLSYRADARFHLRKSHAHVRHRPGKEAR
jgi:hypothetical protein